MQSVSGSRSGSPKREERELLWRAAEIAGELLDLPAPERPGRLEALAGGDTALCAAVGELLADSDAAERFFEARPPLSLLARTAPSLEGRQIGPYRLLDRLGKGGMGQVYRAERAEGFEQRVAVKLIREELGSAAGIRRFENERQILARLEHPNVARLLDGGTADDGLPYLVMELVEGEPIDRYCARRDLSTAAKVRLFLKVCSAVAALHANLVVHRDLKPGNVLVGADGEPKLLDFGIAKPLRPLARLHPQVTEDGRPPLTLLYASPEQVRGEQVVPASDVFSLGVLLYQLLTGSLPWNVDLGRFEEVARAICEREPLRPSAAAAAHGIRLPADLDAILLKTLRKRPALRYASVEQLAADLERFLAAEPVAACEGGWRYRAGRFLRRHRVAAAFAVLLAALAATSLHGWQRSVETRISLQHAEQDRVRMARFLEDLFKAAAPEAGGRTVSALDLLDRGRDQLLADIELPPDSAADLLSTLAQVYASMGRFEEAEDLLEDAVAAVEKGTSGDMKWRLARDLNNLASVRLDRGEPDVAEPLFRRSRALYEVLGAEHAWELAAVLGNLASIHRQRGELDEAETLYQWGLELRIGAFGEGSDPVARSRYCLATVLLDRGRVEEAEELLHQSLKIRREQPFPSAEVATTLSSLGRLLQAEGRKDEALTSFREAVEIRTLVYGEEHEYVALSQIDLSVVLADLGMVAEAEDLSRRAAETLTGREVPAERLARLDVARGAQLSAHGRFAEAVEILRSGYEVMVRNRDKAAYTRWVAERLAEAEARIPGEAALAAR